jgi:Flp pilus assembly protein TadG
MIKDIYQKINFFHKSDKGAVLILVSLIMLPMLLMVGLAVDSANGLKNQKKLLMACDAAAKAGAANGGGVLATITSQAQSVFTANTSGMTGITGPNVSQSSSGVVTVSASIVVTNYFMTLGGIPTNTYSATATALQPYTGGIYALDSSASGAVNVGTSSTLSAVNSNVFANSSNSTAVELSSYSLLTTGLLNIVGNYSMLSGSTITSTRGIRKSTTAVSNPLGTLTIPSYSSCNHTNYSVSGSTVTLSPGVYCNGLTVSGGANVTLSAGNYIIDGGSFSITGATVTGTSGVTIILTKQIEPTYANFSIGAWGTVSLTAPTSGTFNGVAIYQNPNAPGSVTNLVSGPGAVFTVNGSIAIPTQILSLSNGAVINNNTCSNMIVDQIQLAGGSGFYLNNCK